MVCNDVVFKMLLFTEKPFKIFAFQVKKKTLPSPFVKYLTINRSKHCIGFGLFLWLHIYEGSSSIHDVVEHVRSYQGYYKASLLKSSSKVNQNFSEPLKKQSQV